MRCLATRVMSGVIHESQVLIAAQLRANYSSPWFLSSAWPGLNFFRISHFPSRRIYHVCDEGPGVGRSSAAQGDPGLDAVSVVIYSRVARRVAVYGRNDPHRGCRDAESGTRLELLRSFGSFGSFVPSLSRGVGVMCAQFACRGDVSLFRLRLQISRIELKSVSH